MKRSRLEVYNGGWFIGNFEPAIVNSADFEVCLKTFSRGEGELEHFQKTSQEITLVVSGTCRMGKEILVAGDIILLEPGELSDFEALEDSVVLGIKTPSLPHDKIVTGS